MGINGTLDYDELKKGYLNVCVTSHTDPNLITEKSALAAITEPEEWLQMKEQFYKKDGGVLKDSGWLRLTPQPLTVLLLEE